MNKAIILSLVAVVLTCLSACSQTPEIEATAQQTNNDPWLSPWVKPYERENLNKAVMSWDLDPVANAYMHHVYQARESARGAEGTSGGGCGCN